MRIREAIPAAAIRAIVSGTLGESGCPLEQDGFDSDLDDANETKQAGRCDQTFMLSLR